MDLLGGLNPTIYNQAQTSNLTRQQQEQAQQLQNMLQAEGQNKGNQKFTSPWQVAGQWANALAAKRMQNTINPNYAALNAQQPYGNGQSPPQGNTQSPTQSGLPDLGSGTGVSTPWGNQLPQVQQPGQDLPWSGNKQSSDSTSFMGISQMAALDPSSFGLGDTG